MQGSQHQDCPQAPPKSPEKEEEKSRAEQREPNTFPITASILPLPPVARKRTRGGRVKESSWGEEGAKRALQKLQPFESSLSS